MLYAIVDIETAGGSASQGGITEIAVVTHDGERIVDKWETLIHPEQSIPSYITGLTGIDDEMVSTAPTFSEISGELLKVLEGKVFVAHQVNFDYGFIREAFNREGMDYSSKKLCTVRLARKVFPNLRSYSLGRLCESKGIKIEARHRAMGDAKATAILFGQMIGQSPEIVSESLSRSSGESFLPTHFSKAKYDKTPEACGVYYMLDEHGKEIYVGKAINIKERFKNHFSGRGLDKRKSELKNEVHDLRWELTGSEFFALLFETIEIKRLWPKYNSATKRPNVLWGLFDFVDGNGFQRLQVSKVKKGLTPREVFFSREESNSFLTRAKEAYNLCGKLIGQRKVGCDQVPTENCSGACKGDESPKTYNQRVLELFQTIKDSRKEIQIELPGRSQDEKLTCVFESGILSKYAFYTEQEDSQGGDAEFVFVPNIPETSYVLRQFIHTLKPEQIRVLNPV